MVELKSIAGGSGSDPVLCDYGHRFGPSNPVAVINHEGKVYCELCGSGKGPWIGDVWIGDHLPEHPAVARAAIQKPQKRNIPKSTAEPRARTVEVLKGYSLEEFL